MCSVQNISMCSLKLNQAKQEMNHEYPFCSDSDSTNRLLGVKVPLKIKMGFLGPGNTKMALLGLQKEATSRMWFFGWEISWQSNWNIIFSKLSTKTLYIIRSVLVHNTCFNYRFMSPLDTWNIIQNPSCLWLDVNHFYQSRKAWG